MAHAWHADGCLALPAPSLSCLGGWIMPFHHADLLIKSVGNRQICVGNEPFANDRLDRFRNAHFRREACEGFIDVRLKGNAGDVPQHQCRPAKYRGGKGQMGLWKRRKKKAEVPWYR